MPSYRKTAIAVGVLFIACSAASILSAVPLGSILDAPADLARLLANDNRVILTALIEFVWAATGLGIAIALYPVLRKHHRALALGSVAARAVEGAFVIIGSLSLLALLTVGQESVAAGSAAANSYQAAGDALLAVREWALGFVAFLPFALGALAYYYVLYRSRLVPRWLSGWGLVGAGLCLVATVYSGFTQEFGFSTVNTVINIPIGVQEMVLAVWLIAKGFNPSAVTPSFAVTSSSALTSSLAPTFQQAVQGEGSVA
jgi:hypothetical protein